MNFAKNFINRLNESQLICLKKNYNKYVNSLSAYTNRKTFLDWIDSYKDLPNILWSMTK